MCLSVPCAFDAGAEQQRQEQQQAMLENEMEYRQAVIEERDEGIEAIQNSIGEVNEIFQDLAVLIDQQGGQIGTKLTYFSLSLFLLIRSPCPIDRRCASLTCLTHIIPPRFVPDYLCTDDIENNIVATAVRTQQANEELIKAERHQRAGRTRLCVVGVIILIAVLIIVLTLRH